jgi:hypothetical protein
MPSIQEGLDISVGVSTVGHQIRSLVAIINYQFSNPISPCITEMTGALLTDCDFGDNTGSNLYATWYNRSHELLHASCGLSTAISSLCVSASLSAFIGVLKMNRAMLMHNLHVSFSRIVMLRDNGASLIPSSNQVPFFDEICL